MQLADRGEVFGHFVIPYVEDEKIRDALFKAVTQFTQRYPGIQDAELTSIAGECDLLLHLYTSDFRAVADFQAEVTDSYSLASSWLYAIPYEQPGAAGAWPRGDLEFFIYMRVHRHYYACFGNAGEKALNNAISELLKDTGGELLSGRVLYSLGWPDLIVHGRVSGDIQHLRYLITSLQSLSFLTIPAMDSKSETETPIFLKTITVIGTPTALSDTQDLHSEARRGIVLPVPVLFGRSRPGLMAEAVQAVHDIFERGAQAPLRRGP